MEITYLHVDIFKFTYRIKFLQYFTNFNAEEKCDKNKDLPNFYISFKIYTVYFSFAFPMLCCIQINKMSFPIILI